MNGKEYRIIKYRLHLLSVRNIIFNETNRKQFFYGGRKDLKKVKKTISILLCLLLLGGILSETGMQGGILPQTVQAAGRYTGWKTVSGKRYYYQNGRMLKGMSKIGNDYYCFNYQGVQLKGWVYTKNH